MDFQHWYALFVVTGQEDAICRHIEYALRHAKTVRAQAFVPKRRLKERKGGIVIEACKAMFPGYVLIGTEQISELSGPVSGIDGVIRFLKDREGFQEVRPEEIAGLIHMAGEDGVISESKVRLGQNDRVEVLSGPLKGFDGWITKLNRRKSRVAISVLFGAERREVWLGAEFVDRIDGEGPAP
jgi:transcriptional antiterminator NusG